MHLEYTNDLLRVKGVALFVDAGRPVPLSFVSHAHWDHLQPHGILLATPATCDLATARVGENTATQPLAYYHPLTYGPYRIELLSAGHCLGSAQLAVHDRTSVTVYTGDLGRAGLLLGGSVDVTPCDDLVLDATYGTPAHRYPSPAAARARLLSIVRDALASNRPVVVFAHALGRAQEAAATLLAAGIPVAASDAVWQMARVYASHGAALDGLRRQGGRPQRGVVQLYADRARGVAAHRLENPVRIALSGMTSTGAAATLGVDEVVPLVDHADFDELLDHVLRVRPRRVWTLFANAAAFAETLRGHGIQAQALRPPDQLRLL